MSEEVKAPLKQRWIRVCYDFMCLWDSFCLIRTTAAGLYQRFSAVRPSAHLTPESSALRMAASCSVKSGSTLVWMETSWPRASAALSLTARLESCRAFRKVVCS